MEIAQFPNNPIDMIPTWRHVNPKTGKFWFINCSMAETSGYSYKNDKDATPDYFDVYLKQAELL